MFTKFKFQDCDGHFRYFRRVSEIWIWELIYRTWNWEYCKFCPFVANSWLATWSECCITRMTSYLYLIVHLQDSKLSIKILIMMSVTVSLFSIWILVQIAWLWLYDQSQSDALLEVIDPELGIIFGQNYKDDNTLPLTSLNFLESLACGLTSHFVTWIM